MLETAFIAKGLYFLINRIASWFGVGYFFKKAYREKRPIYYLYAVCLSLLMLGILYLGYKLIALLIHFFAHLKSA